MAGRVLRTSENEAIQNARTVLTSTIITTYLTCNALRQYSADFLVVREGPTNTVCSFPNFRMGSSETWPAAFSDVQEPRKITTCLISASQSHSILSSSAVEC